MEMYNDDIEIQFDKLVCTIEENPVIFTDPVERSSYLDVNLYTSAEGFQYNMLQPLYNKYIAYFDQFIKTNIGTSEGQKIFESTFRRVSAKYQNIHQRFIDSAKRQEWKHQSKNFIIHNPDNDFNIAKQQKYTRQAYQFFWKMSATQLYFIDEIKQYLDQQLRPYNAKAEPIINTSIVIPPNNEVIIENPIYHFSIHLEATKESHNILQYIWKQLKANDFISCTLPQFKQVFTSKTPIPIVWQKDYIQLSYLIKKMSPKFLLKPKTPSNYLVATKIFYNKSEGNFFNPSKIRHDKDPNSADRNLIDLIIMDSIDYFIRG